MSSKKHTRDWEDEDDHQARKEKRKSEKKVEKVNGFFFLSKYSLLTFKYQVAKMLGYSNEINPFGDTNLLKPFVWGKKQETEKVKEKKHKKHKKEKKHKKKSSGSSDDSSDDSSEDDRANKISEEEKRLKLLEEIEKVRKRRENREQELAEMERLRDEEQRLRELASFNNWKEKEEEFHLEQIKERTKIRLLEDRVYLIDRLLANILLYEASEKILSIFRNNYRREIQELYHPEDYSNSPNQQLLQLLSLHAEITSAVDIIFEENSYHQLTVQDYQLLKEDILQLKELDERKKIDKYMIYWTSLLKIIDALIKRTKRQEANELKEVDEPAIYGKLSALESNNNNNKRASSSYEKVQADIESLLKQKSLAELTQLEEEIQNNLKTNKRNLANRHQNYSDNSQSIDIDYWEHMLEEIEFFRNKILLNKFHEQLFHEFVTNIQELKNHQLLLTRRDDNNIIIRRKTTYQPFFQPEKSSSSSSSSTSKGSKFSSLFSDPSNFAKLQDSVIEEYLKDIDKDIDVEETEETKMLASEEIFLPISQDQYSWQDKYRPRKPRYFNRVKTGWDRNKYNLTHYDADNPPPKMIQGYKFTIFYPDLIDKTVTPKYYLEPCPDEKNSHEFVMIRFHAGPPYEDIAFKIINKQWDTYKRAGFLCTFDRGILQLHFNFKKAFYRR